MIGNTNEIYISDQTKKYIVYNWYFLSPQTVLIGNVAFDKKE